jgi:hypothetical protein
MLQMCVLVVHFFGEPVGATSHLPCGSSDPMNRQELVNRIYLIATGAFLATGIQSLSELLKALVYGDIFFAPNVSSTKIGQYEQTEAFLSIFGFALAIVFVWLASKQPDGS